MLSPASVALQIQRLAMSILVLGEILIALCTKRHNFLVRFSMGTHHQKVRIPFLCRVVRFDNFGEAEVVLAADEKVHGFHLDFNCLIHCLHFVLGLCISSSSVSLFASQVLSRKRTSLSTQNGGVSC